MAAFKALNSRVLENRNSKLIDAAIFTSSLVLALFLISTSIESIGPTLLVIGKQEDQPQVFNDLRLIGIDLNRSALFGIGNWYSVDYVILNMPKTDFLRVSVGEYYDNGTWYTKDTVRASYNGEIIPYPKADQPVNYTELMVWNMIDTKGYIPEPDYPRELSYFQMNYSRGRYDYDEYEAANCSFDETLWLFVTNTTIEPWTRYKVDYYYTDNEVDQLEIVQREEEKYTQVPEDIFEDIHNRAKFVTEEAETDYDKVLVLIDYLHKGYEPTWAWRDAPYDADPVHWFLFKEHKGISIHFNSALVLMARSLGISSRVVGGYPLSFSKIQFPAPWDRVVYAEFWFKDVGWLRFDATPLPEFVDTGPLRSTTIRTGRHKKAVETEIEGESNQRLILFIATVIIFGILVFLVDSLIEFRRRRETEGAPVELLNNVDERLGIRFKEIEQPLPNIWGINEPITVVVESQFSGELNISMDTKEKRVQGFRDQLEETRTFSKGGHTVKATLKTARTGTKITSRIGLRIVDYREEIVELFNQVLKDPELAANWWRLTAREIQGKIRKNYPSLSEIAVERYASLFEVADYSQHVVNREVYVRFFLAKKELEEAIGDGQEE